MLRPAPAPRAARRCCSCRPRRRAASDQVMTFEAPGELLDDGRARGDARRDPVVRRHPRPRARLLARVHGAAGARASRRASTPPTTTAYPAGHVGPARPARRLDPAPRHGRCSSRSPARCRSGRRSASSGNVDDPSAEAVRPLGRAPSPPRYGDRVNLWSIWNEPNHPDFLGPQYKARQAAHAEALPQALRRRRARDPRRRRATRRTRSCSARPRRSATQNVVSPLALPARRAVPEPRLQEAQGLQEAADRRLRAPRLHAQGRPDVRRPRTPTRSASARSAGSTEALDKAARAGAIDSQPRHLPDRVRHPEQARPDRRRLARAPGRVHRDLRADRLREPAREGVLAVPDARRPAAQGRPRLERYSGFETGLRTSKGKKKPAYNAFMLPLAATRYGSSDVLWGRVRPDDSARREVTIEHKHRQAASGSG